MSPPCQFYNTGTSNFQSSTKSNIPQQRRDLSVTYIQVQLHTTNSEHFAFVYLVG